MNNKKHNRRVKKLLILCLLSAIIVTVSTYAWFIGMKTVNVNEFQINIATTEGLFLSLDGDNWSYTLDVGKTATAYAGNTNVWADDGLIPMSSVGDMDATSSTMKLYEKASLTAVPGGYRLLASRVDNHTAKDGKYPEGKGYVAFDLFVKNLSGNEYYTDNEPLNEEAIYLTTNSEVKVSTSGGVQGTGIENSVRVGFVQIGRVKGTTEDVDTITGITCSEVKNGEDVVVTGICRDAQIWEPNDTKHVKNAINWYNESCLLRKSTGSTVIDSASYSTETTDKCGEVKDTEAKKTYAISRAITVNDNVNVYDGGDYNTYTANTVDYETYHNQTNAETKAGYKLVDFPYFTDTMKDLTSTSRPTFMTLAPNSVTKLRVYVWIEGQDVDNYDFAQLGHQITINFGFTKERYDVSKNPQDFEYDGPNTVITNEATNPLRPTNNTTNIGG